MKPRVQALYDGAPFFLKPFLWPAKYLYYRWLPLWDYLTLEAWTAEGTELSGGQPFSIAYAGVEIHMNHLFQLAFGENYQRRRLGRFWVWRAYSRMKRLSPQCPLFICEIPQKRDRLFFTPSHFRSPVWISAEMDAAQGKERIIRGKQMREIGRILRKHGYQCSVATDSDSFDDFYAHMYAPYTRKRHGASAFVYDHALLKKKLAHMELLFVEKDGERLAGGINDYSYKNPQLTYFGIREGKEEFAKAGLVDALNYFSIEQMLKKGVPVINIGESRAFLKDRPLQYKLRMGAVLTRHDLEFGCMHIRFERETPGLKAFLANNPFIYVVGPRKYRAAVFAENPGEACSQPLVRQWMEGCPESGLSGVDILCWKDRPFARREPLVKTLCAALPRPLNAAFKPANYFYYRWRALRDFLSLDVWKVQGRETSGGGELAFLYAGVDSHKHYLSRLAFGENFTDRYLGRRWIWELRKTAEKEKDCALLAIEAGEKLERFCGAKKGHRIPVWIHAEIRAGGEGEDGIRGRKLREMHRVVAKYGYQSEVVGDAASFDDFYFNMYMPFTERKYGKTAFFHDYALLKEKLAQGELVFVKKDGQRLVGGLIDYSGQTPWIVYMGVRETGDEATEYKGTVDSFFLFAITRITEKGGKGVNLGDSRAFLKDGALIYKMRMGAAVTRHDRVIGCLRLEVLNQTAALKAFLANNPFIEYIEPDKYGGVVFSQAAENDPRIREWQENAAERGLAGIKVL